MERYQIELEKFRDDAILREEALRYCKETNWNRQEAIEKLSTVYHIEKQTAEHFVDKWFENFTN